MSIWYKHPNFLKLYENQNMFSSKKNQNIFRGKTKYVFLVEENQNMLTICKLHFKLILVQSIIRQGL
jgi:hypothetical protein